MKNKKSNKVIISFVLFMLILVSLVTGITPNKVARANILPYEDGQVVANYKIFDEYGNYLFEKSKVVIGDFYLSKSFNKYEIVYLNHNTKTGMAKFVEKVEKPKVSISPNPQKISTGNKKIGLYCTHNDESYLPSDGYYTIYGKGGIHDIARLLKNNFENMGISVSFNETLHLPHDGLAYSRSKPTAQKLLKDNLDALFDIHRDGIPRSYYATKVNGEERSKIRIVVGQANANMKANEKLAIYISAIADELYPWLISDIYYAKGHYNQNLFEKALLFEMGTYLIEKELVEKSVPPLVHIINVALFGTTVDKGTGELEIGGGETSVKVPVNESISDLVHNVKNNKNNIEYFVVFALSTMLVLVLISKIFVMVYLNYVKPKMIKK